MPRLKKAVVHEIWREDALAIGEIGSMFASSLEEIIAAGFFAAVGTDIFLIHSVEVHLTKVSVGLEAFKWTAEIPGQQWVADHRLFFRMLLINTKNMIDYSILGFKPFIFLTPLEPMIDHYLDVTGFKTRLGTTGYWLDALPIMDRILFASAIPTLSYWTTRIMANLPSLVGHLLPG